MPINKYFGGNGSKVMANMKNEYGGDKGEQVFYATANKNGEKPGGKHGKKKHSNHSLQGIKNAVTRKSERGDSAAHERGESKSFERTED